MIKPQHIVMLMLALAGVVAPVSAVETLAEARKIRSLSRENAAKSIPVKLTGVVIYQSIESLVLHDGEAAIYLDFPFSKQQGVWLGGDPDLSRFIPGTEALVEGVTDPGGFSPMVLVSKIEKIGSKPMPKPLRLSIDHMLLSTYDCQWVEVEGIVRKFDAATNDVETLMLMLDGHPCQVVLPGSSGLTSEKLVDAKIRLRGVLMNIANLRSQTAGMKIHCSGSDDITILTPPPTDPFQAPHLSIENLASYQPGVDFGHRVVSSGLVTFVTPSVFYLMANGVSVRVESEAAGLTPGDLVEVSGFLDASSVLTSFRNTLVKKIGTGTVPPAVEPSVFEILNPKTRSAAEMVSVPGHPDFDGRIVRLKGILRRVLPSGADGNSALIMDSESYLVHALLPGSAPPWEEGSMVELTGVCRLEIVRIDRKPWFSIEGFHLLLSSPADLKIISKPAWWTPRRLNILLAGVLLVLLVTLVWGYAMRRQVSIRGAQLAAEISARETAQIEHETTLRERQRLANDLHDTLEQSLMGVALQLEIANRSRATDPDRSTHHMALASQFLERSRREVHRTVWDLRTLGQDGKDFLDILKERVSSMVSGSDVAITLNREGVAYPIPELIAGNLLLLAQEAVTNALKHSGASEISILLRIPPGAVELTISDNGCGFDPTTAPGQQQGHFGLQGMRERTKRLGGTIEWISSPGHGTTLQVQIPLFETASEKST